MFPVWIVVVWMAFVLHVHGGFMVQGEFLFIAMMVIFGLTITVVGSVVTSESADWRHRFLQCAYILPATVLMADMLSRYAEFHDSGRFHYGGLEMTLDVLCLTFLYASLAQLGKSPVQEDTSVFLSYPSQTFWSWLIAYSLLKLIRIWPMVIPKGGDGVSYYFVLHAGLTIFILVGWYWQRLLRQRRRLPSFIWSGVIFSVGTAIYMISVYSFKWNPLSPCITL